MNPEPEETSYLQLGYYAPDEARRLFAAFERAGIRFDAEFFDGMRSVGAVSSAHGGHYGRSAQVLISIEEDRMEEVAQIHADIFGDCLPTVDSSYFDDEPRPP